jgi:solute carrier family 35 protein F5
LYTTAYFKCTFKHQAYLYFLDDIQWFIANYTYQLALSNTEAGTVNVLSSSSSLFTLLLAAIFPSVTADKFTLSKLLAVLFSFGGVVSGILNNRICPSLILINYSFLSLILTPISDDLQVVVSLSDMKMEGKTIPLGAVFALISALFYALYLVFLRKKVDHEDKLDIPMFFGEFKQLQSLKNLGRIV